MLRIPVNSHEIVIHSYAPASSGVALILRISLPLLILIALLTQPPAVFAGYHPASSKSLADKASTPPLSTARATLRAPSATPPVGLQFTALPSLVDVGQEVILSVSASHWNGPASVKVAFLSRHHGFSGVMTYQTTCLCFRIGVFLARRIHPLEQARAVAQITYQHGQVQRVAFFTIRGLARNGRNYAPGGKLSLTTWVSDPRPLAREYQHYCVWVRTADALGVTGVPTRFVVHFDGATRTYTAGKTASTGIACVQRSVGTPLPGVRVNVDAYAGRLHARTAFTPRG